MRQIERLVTECTIPHLIFSRAYKQENMNKVSGCCLAGVQNLVQQNLQ